MAGLKVFISSTCYDLSILRSNLRNFVSSLGYEPVMSDYADIVYDPRLHTHTSCVQEVRNCDMLIVIIGSRYGGKGVPEAINTIDQLSVNELMKKTDGKLSITQLEVIEALQNNIPVYTFIDKKVYHQHELYEKNKENAESIIFTAIDKPETAKYIFEFINFLRLKSIGNFIFEFEKMQDIEETLKKQWSGYFQRLLSEQRYRIEDHKHMDILSEKFDDLKTALLSSIRQDNDRKVAKGIVNYRRLIEFLLSLKITKNTLLHSKSNFKDLLFQNNIVNVISSKDLGVPSRYLFRRIFLIKDDSTFFECRLSFDVFKEIELDWDLFIEEKTDVKELILDTLIEIYYPKLSACRYISEPFNSYINDLLERLEINEPVG